MHALLRFLVLIISIVLSDIRAFDFEPECELITGECVAELKYKETYKYLNVSNNYKSQEMRDEIISLFKPFEDNFSRYKPFLCVKMKPICSRDLKKVIQPCKSYCLRNYYKCEKLYNRSKYHLQIPFPDFLKCDGFTDDKPCINEEMIAVNHNSSNYDDHDDDDDNFDANFWKSVLMSLEKTLFPKVKSRVCVTSERITVQSNYQVDMLRQKCESETVKKPFSSYFELNNIIFTIVLILNLITSFSFAFNLILFAYQAQLKYSYFSIVIVSFCTFIYAIIQIIGINVSKQIDDNYQI